MNRKIVLALLGCGVGLSVLADEPLLWLSDFSFLKSGEISSSISGGLPVKKENGRSFVTIEGRKFNILAGLPNGSAFGDIRFSFAFRPHDNNFSFETSLHLLSGGSRRFRRDMLHNIRVTINGNSISVTPTYVRGQKYENIRHMTSAPRDHGDGLKPFPEIQAKTYNLPAKFAWKIDKWQKIKMVMDQYKLIVSVDGRELVKHPINPGAGAMNLTCSGGNVDFADFEIREIRPAFDPYLPENLLTEKKNPLRTPPLKELPKPPPPKPEQKKAQKKK